MKILASVKKSQFLWRRRKVIIISAFVACALLAFMIVWANSSARSLEKYAEVTFISPTQALVFWKSDKETLGYVTYATNWYGRRSVESQTSSEAGMIHVVVIDHIPSEGLYIQKWNEGDPFWIIPPLVHIKYSGSEPLDE